MQIKRRDFFKQSALGVSGMLLGAKLAPAAPSEPAYFGPFERVTLGKTKLKLTRVCMGTGVEGAATAPPIRPGWDMRNSKANQGRS